MFNKFTSFVLVGSRLTDTQSENMLRGGDKGLNINYFFLFRINIIISKLCCNPSSLNGTCLCQRWSSYKFDLSGQWSSYKFDLAGQWSSYKFDLSGQWSSSFRSNYIRCNLLKLARVCITLR